MAFINRLTNEEQETLDNFINNNEKTMQEFEKYQKSIDFVLNIGFSFDDEDKLEFDSINLRLKKTRARETLL